MGDHDRDETPDQTSREPEPEETAGEAAPPTAEADRLASLEAENTALQDRLLRTLADFDNYKKRINREKQDLRKYGTERFARELLPVIDNFERALQQAGEAAEASALIEGIEMILKQLMDVLSSSSISPIAALGMPFDPAHHEALAQRPDAEAEPNTVVEEYQRGYMLHDRLLRPARVVVSTAPDTDDDQSRP